MIPLRAYLYGGALLAIALVAWSILSAYTNWQDGVKQVAWQSGYDTAHAEVTAVLTAERAAVQAEREAFEREARAAEQAHQGAMDAIAAKREQDRIDAQVDHERLVADLERGTVRLHQRWQAAVATADLAKTVQSAAERDAAARDREESSARIVRAARDADDQIRQLQAIVIADRAMLESARTK